MAQNTYAVAWFKGKELNMVFGFQVNSIYSLHVFVYIPVPVLNLPPVLIMYFAWLLVVFCVS